MKKPSLYPPGAIHINWFSVFNAVTFQIVVGSPMILYAKSLGANATVIGLIAALPFLLGTLQVPGNHLLGHLGYKRTILTGWAARTVLTIAVALVPLAGFLGPAGKITVVIAALFVYHLIRGITVGAWLPWLTDLIPAAVRGRFLSRDQIFVHLGCLIAVLVSAVVLAEKSTAGQFAAIFWLAAFAGCAALLFVVWMPEVTHREALEKSGARVPWRRIVGDPAFLRLSIFNILFIFATNTVTVFTVPFLKTKIGFGDNRILYLSMLYFLGAMLSLPLVGRVLDRMGSRPILNFSLVLWAAILAGWSGVAGGWIAPSLWFLGLLHFAGGVAGSNLGLANMRLAMHTMPHTGRSHFLAFFSVITSIAMGLAPVAWGAALDGMARIDTLTAAIHGNRFAVYFTALFALTVVSAVFTHFLHEKNDA